MKILLITHGEFLDRNRIASGNSVRSYYLERGLAESGFDIVHTYPEGLGRAADPRPEARILVRPYADRSALAQLIKEELPDALIVGYWELIEELPDQLDMPIILDVVAPRILEAMYQDHLDLPSEVWRTLSCYRRADRFLVGNRRQGSFLLGWLILAGFDCRVAAPIDVVPISTEINAGRGAVGAAGSLRFVSGGVTWPWRQTEVWFDRLVKSLAGWGKDRAELALFSGNYVYAAPQGAPSLSLIEASWPESIVKRYPLLPYGEMQSFLRNRCHIGVELAEENLERQYSQSFRAMEFLSNGLPLICNGYTELATSVRDYDAGWVVDDLAQLDAVVREIFECPETVSLKSANALRLVDAHFHYAHSIQPVVKFLRDPVKPALGESLVPLGPNESDRQATEGSEVSIRPPSGQVGVPGMADALPRTGTNPGTPALQGVAATTRLALKGLFRPIIRAVAKIHSNNSIILISRSDIRPANHGAAVKIDRTAWALSHRVKAVYLLSENRTTYYEVKGGVSYERHFPRVLRHFGPAPKRVREAVVAAGVPTDDAFLYDAVFDWSFIVRAIYLALGKGARVYQAEFPGYARAAVWARDLLGGTALLAEHNVEYKRLAEQNPGLDADGLRFLKDVEIGLCRRSDIVITVSDSDRERLIADGVGGEHIHVIPHGVDLEEFDHAAPLDLHAAFGIPMERAILVYHGIYLYPPNLEAMAVMAREILPRLERLGAKATVLAIGRNPPEGSLHRDMIFSGPVPSVAPYLKAADIAVVPLQKGGGTRMKILDYFAAGIPVVSTSKGAEGIPIEPGIQAVIANSYDDFAQAIADLLNDAPARRAMGQAGRRFVMDLGWRAIASRYLELL